MLATLLLTAQACGGDGAGGDPGDAGSTGSQCQPGQPFQLDGARAGVLATLNVRINPNGGIPENQPATAELLLLVDIAQSGRNAAVTARLCDLKIPEVPLAGQDQPIRLQPGPLLVPSIPEQQGTGTLSGETTCSTFETDPLTIVVGARMDPPAEGTLPEADDQGNFTTCVPDDCLLAIGSQCACDQEDDGKPGATLLAMNLPALAIEEVYVDLRTTFSLDGEVWSSDRIRGTVTATLEQGVLGCAKANGVACTTSELRAVRNLNPEIGQDPTEPSTFAAERVAPDLTCDDLIVRRNEIFPR